MERTGSTASVALVFATVIVLATAGASAVAATTTGPAHGSGTNHAIHAPCSLSQSTIDSLAQTVSQGLADFGVNLSTGMAEFQALLANAQFDTLVCNLGPNAFVVGYEWDSHNGTSAIYFVFSWAGAASAYSEYWIGGVGAATVAGPFLQQSPLIYS